MKSGSGWLVVVAFPDSNPLFMIEPSREVAIESIQDLPDHTGKVYLFKLNFYKGRIYAKRQHKID